MFRYAKFDPSIPCGSRVVCIFMIGWTDDQQSFVHQKRLLHMPVVRQC